MKNTVKYKLDIRWYLIFYIYILLNEQISVNYPAKRKRMASVLFIRPWAHITYDWMTVASDRGKGSYGCQHCSRWQLETTRFYTFMVVFYYFYIFRIKQNNNIKLEIYVPLVLHNGTNGTNCSLGWTTSFIKLD